MTKMTSQENEVVVQFLSDNIQSKTPESLPKALIDALVDNMYNKSENVTADAVLSFELSRNGGNITISKNIGECKYDYERNFMSFSGYESSVYLIEPLDYASADVQPFNRQGVFYVPHSFETLGEPTVIEGFKVYHKSFDRTKSSYASQMVQPYINDFWHRMSFSAPIKLENAQELVFHLLRILSYPTKIAKHVVL